MGPQFKRTGLAGLLTAFPRSIEKLRPALHLAKDIGSPFRIVIGQVMPLSLEGNHRLQEQGEAPVLTDF